jgi:hypothetical protein
MCLELRDLHHIPDRAARPISRHQHGDFVMRKLILMTGLVLASASAQAQPIDVGSILSANGISLGNAGGQQLPGAIGQGGAGLQQAGVGGQGGAGAQAGADPQGAAGAAGQGQSQAQSQRQTRRGKQGRSRESAQETKARTIAARYGISW